MRRLTLPAALLLILTGAYFALRPYQATISEFLSSPTKDDSPNAELRAAIEAALDEAVLQSPEIGLAYVVFEVQLDQLRISPDGAWALFWMNALDRETQQVAAIEPWLGIGVLEGDKWRVSLPGHKDFPALLERVPDKIITEEERMILGNWAGMTCDTSSIGPFFGYRLPWKGGQILNLTQSIFHTLGWGFNPTYSMIHAFDFSTSPSSFFEIWAARPGTVKYFWDSQPNNDPDSPGNYIVIEDTGTTPTSYQLYLHLAQGSIPGTLKAVGVPVQQGQFLGIADDTGASSNHHLHFQVHTEVNWWGCSVDVLFQDVPINGGRPRLPVEAETHPEYGAQGQTAYVSGNSPPSTDQGQIGGGMTVPFSGQTISGEEIYLEGYAFDFLSGVQQAQFGYKVNQTWIEIGNPLEFSGEPGTVFFNQTIATCGEGIPDGPVTFGIIAHNQSDGSVRGGLGVPVILDADCPPPPPPCTPGSEEVAVFELVNYLGSCTLFGIGDHAQDFEARSLLVGESVSISLYLSSQYRARSQTFFDDDPNLSDDRSALDLYGSARVRLRSQPPGEPVPNWPASGEMMPMHSNFSLVWHDGGGSQAFQSRIIGASKILTSTWRSDPFWYPGLLDPGDYNWEVRARNQAGESAWSAPGMFSIASGDLLSVSDVITAPVTEDFESLENGWSSTGFWNRISDTSGAYSGENAWWYGKPPGDYLSGDYRNGTLNAGSLTSPPIHIPDAGYVLRFYSRYETEGSGPIWDKRTVWISVDGGPYKQVYTLSEDLMNRWGPSAPIDLSDYSGSTVQVRFVFETLDARFNRFSGWLLDLFTIDQSPQPTCSQEGEPNDGPSTASALLEGVPTGGEICPAGDIDFYTFSANAGDYIMLDIDAQSIGSELDAYIFLLSDDGSSVIVENDDESPGIQLDSLIEHTLQETGTYYVKVRSYDHPAAGGDDSQYTLRLELDFSDPVIQNLTASVPLEDIGSLPGEITLTAEATDSDSGLVSVEFLYHSNDWGLGNWIHLGIDMDGADGWTAVWNTAVLRPQPGMALLAVARDRAGNPAAMGLWDLFPLPEAIYLPGVWR